MKDDCRNTKILEKKERMVKRCHQFILDNLDESSPTLDQRIAYLLIVEAIKRH